MRDKVLLCIGFLATSALCTFLTHVVDVLNRDIILLDECFEKIKMSVNSGSIECLSLFGIQARWLPKHDLWMSLEKSMNTSGTWLLSSEDLCLLLYRSFADWVHAI